MADRLVIRNRLSLKKNIDHIAFHYFPKRLIVILRDMDSFLRADTKGRPTGSNVKAVSPHRLSGLGGGGISGVSMST